MDKQRMQWFPMRVTYGRTLQVLHKLEEHGLRCFVPRSTKVQKVKGHIQEREVAAVSGLLFVFSSMEQLLAIKRGYIWANPLRFMVHRKVHTPEAPAEVITVPDQQMEQFIRVASVPNEQVFFLTADELDGKVGRTVTIVDGPFKGVQGVLRRVKGNRRVVVEIEGVGGICIQFVPRKFILQQTT